MKVRVLSDLHNECVTAIDSIELIPIIPNEKEQVLALAGDIFVISKSYTYITFLDNMCSRFKHVVFVPGNHEYYRSSMSRAKDIFGSLYTPPVNFTWLDGGSTVTVDDVLFVGETLWTDFHNSPESERLAEIYMNDYKLIATGEFSNLKKITAKDILNEHKAALDRLSSNIQDGCVVITHHGVSEMSVAPEYHNNPLNPAFYSELGPWFTSLGKTPKLLIHGHTHSSHSYHMGTMQVVVNPRGYPNHSGTFENRNFDPTLVVEL